MRISVNVLSVLKEIEQLFLAIFYTRVGKDWQSWPFVIGKYGVGKMNCNGLMQLEFCTGF